MAAAVGLALLPAAASAAYAPQLTVTVRPERPSQPVAITTVVTQRSFEEATKTVRLALPTGFAVAAGTAVPACTEAQDNARACPAETQIGTARAVTLLGTLFGNVYFGGIDSAAKAKVIVFLTNGIPLLDEHIVGYMSIRSDGGLDATFDNLPTLVPTTTFELALLGAPKSLLVSPAKCGTYPIVGHFTSAGGARAESSSPVTIAGCPNVAPVISRVAASSSLLRAGHAGTLAFTLSERSSVRVSFRRFGARRAVLVRRLAGVAGRNRLRGIRLAAGRYVAALRATDPQGLSRTRNFALRVAR